MDNATANVSVRTLPTAEEIMVALDDPQALKALLDRCGFTMAEFVAHTEDVRSELEKAKTRLCVV
jgi:hypothetical protein